MLSLRWWVMVQLFADCASPPWCCLPCLRYAAKPAEYKIVSSLMHFLKVVTKHWISWIDIWLRFQLEIFKGSEFQHELRTEHRRVFSTCRSLQIYRSYYSFSAFWCCRVDARPRILLVTRRLDDIRLAHVSALCWIHLWEDGLDNVKYSK